MKCIEDQELCKKDEEEEDEEEEEEEEKPEVLGAHIELQYFNGNIFYKSHKCDIEVDAQTLRNNAPEGVFRDTIH